MSQNCRGLFSNVPLQKGVNRCWSIPGISPIAGALPSLSRALAGKAQQLVSAHLPSFLPFITLRTTDGNPCVLHGGPLPPAPGGVCMPALLVFLISAAASGCSAPSRRRRERQTRFCRPLRASCCALTGSALKSRCCRLHLPANLLWRARCRVAPHHHGELVQQRAHASGHCVRRVQLNLIMSIAEFGQWSCVQPAVSQGQSALRT